MKTTDASSAPAVGSVATGRWVRGLRWLERTCFALLLFAGIFNFPNNPEASLDPSWRLVLARAFYDGLQFGRDIVFTYGPLGFFMGNTYDGGHFQVLIIWQLVKGVAFTAVILHAVERLPVVARWVCVATFLLFGVFFEDMLHLMVMVLLGAWCLREEGPPGPRTSLVIGVSLALLSAIKFTSLLFAVATIAIAAGLNLRLARRASVVMMTLGFIGGFAAIWVLSRQSLGNLPEYLLNSWRISQGYEEAMGLPPPAPALWKALVVLALLALYLGLHFLLHRRQPRALAGVLLLAAFGFLIWKHGFVRADGHMGGFFTGMLFLATTAPVLLVGTDRFRVVKGAVLALVAFFSVWGLDHVFAVTRSNAWTIFTARISSEVNHLAHWQAFRSGYDEELRRLLTVWPLEHTRRIVGHETVDVLGYDAGIVCLHGMNYRPRPVFQSYLAYTSALEQLNRDFFRSSRAPAFVLQKVQTIDSRLQSLDDALVFRLMPWLYEYVLAEDGFLLWRRRPSLSAPPTSLPPPLLAGEHAPGESLRIDHSAEKRLWLELNLPLSLLGRLRAFCYQPPLVQLRLTDMSGTTTYYRLPLAQARGGFILNPIIDDAADYLMFVSGEPGRRVQSLTVMIGPDDRRFFADSFHFSLTGVSLPRSEKSLGGEARRARFHMFKTPPVSETAFVPFTEAEIDARPVMLAHAPSEMRFDLPPRASRVSAYFGFLPGAYAAGGHTDGATFRVVWTDGRRQEILFSRRLDPTNVSVDRGLQWLSMDISSWHGGQLLLQVDPGLAGNNSWDWTAWSGVEIREGPGN